MIATEVVQVFDLVNSDDPILTCESLFDSAELGALVWQLGSSYTILSLAGGEQRIVVVV